jgi:hypothetical protein
MTIRPEDWETLGVEPDADISQVRRAYQRRRELYESDTLATYNLLDDDERASILERIDAAFRRIAGEEPIAHPPAEPAEPPDLEPEVPPGPAPDPVDEPGAHLRHQRLSRGVTLHQVSAVTKIGVPILEMIEREDFEALPAVAFVRGHVHQFARELEIADAYEFTKLYVAKMTNADDDKVER